MKRKTRSLVTLLLASLTMLALFTTAVAQNEPLEITQFVYAPISVQDGALQLAIEDYFNVKLYNVESHDTLVTNIAIGEYPDVAGTGGAEQIDWYRQGILREVPEEVIREYAPAFATAYDMYDPSAWQKASVDGVSIGLSCVYYEFGLPYVSVIRQDWLDAVGAGDMGYEVSLEELEEVFLKFVNDDPDGNNVKDTAALTGTGSATTMQISMIMGAYGVQVGKFVERDGKAVYAATLEDYRSALRTLNRWYQLGIIDLEFATDTDAICSSKFAEGKIGFATGTATHLNPNLKMATLTPLLDYKAIDPNAEWRYITKIVGPNGVSSSGGGDAGLDWNLAFFEHLDDEKTQRILSYFNAMNSSVEAFKLVAFGEENVHYHITDMGTCARDDAQNQLLTTMAQNGELCPGHAHFPLRTPEFGSLIYGDFIDEYMQLPFADKLHINWVPNWPSEAMDKAPDLNDIVNTYTTSAILGKVDLDGDWEEFQAQLANRGIEQITADYNERYQSAK